MNKYVTIRYKLYYKFRQMKLVYTAYCIQLHTAFNKRSTASACYTVHPQRTLVSSKRKYETATIKTQKYTMGQ